MRVLSICRDCCEVHLAGRECPRCAGKPGPPLSFRAGEPSDLPGRPGFGRPHLLGIAVGLVAAAGMLSIIGSL